MELSIIVEGTMFGSPGSMPAKKSIQSFNWFPMQCLCKDNRSSQILLICFINLFCEDHRIIAQHLIFLKYTYRVTMVV